MAMRGIVVEVAGAVSEVMVAVGQTIAAEDTVIFVECMKMQLPVVSPWAGTVRAIRIEAGDLVEEVLVDLEV
jgi:biotin carboxyl carrier protein